MATPIFPQTIKSWFAKILPADTSSLKTLVTAGANGSRIDSIIATSTDSSSARDLQFVITSGGVDYIIDTVQVPTNSGNTNSIAAVNILGHATKFLWAAYDANGNRYLTLASGAVLKVKSLSTVTSAREITVFAQGADY